MVPAIGGDRRMAAVGEDACRGDRAREALNAVCPYYTMFPLSFPSRHLRAATAGDAVLDPFCGRGTTLFAARLAGIPALGVDSNPVAVAISRAKLSAVRPAAVVGLAREILEWTPPDPAPTGEFWRQAYARGTLDQVLRLRAGLRTCRGSAADALRAVVLGALHGPRAKHKASYLSNQMPRTFASKPDYSVRFWADRGLSPPEVDVLAVVEDRAHRYYGAAVRRCRGRIVLGDAREVSLPRRRFSVVITSPPYFGMRSYVPDQWIRYWFLGGPAAPEYAQLGQLAYRGASSESAFAAELGKVWRNVATACIPGARLLVRFGALRSRPCDPLGIVRASLDAADAGWRLLEASPAGDAHRGKRQADQMGARARGVGAVDEYDVACALRP